MDLLNLKGFDLPIASTVLRFARPDKLQIIDQRAFRFVMPEAAGLLKLTGSNESKVDLYFRYLDQLRAEAKKYKVPFKKADRIFYKLDKTFNKGIPLKGFGKR